MFRTCFFSSSNKYDAEMKHQIKQKKKEEELLMFYNPDGLKKPRTLKEILQTQISTSQMTYWDMWGTLKPAFPKSNKEPTASSW